ncbi:tyrosine-type recombinase/integrase (plasmid) [Rothia amarae]|uniref:Tyrosine-type recombinase/integrase n=1 Tax=Rothia amarae TaxID=169480 RepID=A0A7S6WXE5_9MICC|nr:tyrosine-type recombinase/integrase [Rothia amarae]QOW64909.1 tyrosine-type recombinase/integrase [Rothia amarae]
MSSELVEVFSEPSELMEASSTLPNFVKHRNLIASWALSYTSENTQQAYLNDLKIFCTFLDEAGVDLLQVRRTHLDVFSRVHEQYTNSNASVARRLAAISAFYRFLLLDEVIEKSPAEYIRRPAIDPDFTATQALTQREALRLLDAATEHSLRAQTLVDLLLSTGLRISEALNIRESDISEGRLLITRKGGKKSAVYLPEHTLRNLRKLTATTGLEVETQVKTGTSPLVFITRTGRPWQRSNVDGLLRKLALTASIRKTVSAHVLRHTHATLALEMGVALHHLQDSLGHKDPRTTRRYDHARSRLENSSARVVGAVFE